MRRKPGPLHADGKQSFGLDRIAHQHTTPTREPHCGSEDVRVRHVLYDTRDLVEKGGGLSMPSCDRQILRMNRRRGCPGRIGRSFPGCPRLPHRDDGFIDPNLLEKRDGESIMKPSQGNKIRPLSLPRLSFTEIVQGAPNVHCRCEITLGGEGEPQGRIYTRDVLIAFQLAVEIQGRFEMPDARGWIDIKGLDRSEAIKRLRSARVVLAFAESQRLRQCLADTAYAKTTEAALAA